MDGRTYGKTDGQTLFYRTFQPRPGVQKEDNKRKKKEKRHNNDDEKEQYRKNDQKRKMDKRL